ncbi:hypothetical protein KW782_01665 [Candidatus Parcubacteria bacterium]|nr:hypothetical protein [Candidatus Parcubacteria bacterium]
MLNNKKGSAAIILIILAILVIGCGVYYYSNYLNWKTYTNAEYGFEFKYPNKFTLEDYNSDEVGKVIGKEIISPNPSLTKIYVSVFKNYEIIKNISDNNISCELKADNVSFGNNMKAREYACGDAGTTGKVYLISLPQKVGLYVVVTSDSPEATADKQFTELPIVIVEKILSSFKFTSIDIQTGIADLKTYTKPAPAGFEVKYPSDFKVTSNNGIDLNDAGTEKSGPQVIFTYPESYTKGTNLVEAKITVETNKANDTKNCRIDSVRRRSETPLKILPSITANGVTFTGGSNGGAAAGQLYESVIYTASNATTCYVISLDTHSGNIQNYDPPVKAFDSEKVMSVFKQVLSTFKIGS